MADMTADGSTFGASRPVEQRFPFSPVSAEYRKNVR